MPLDALAVARKKGQRKLAALKCGLLLAKEFGLLREDDLAALDAEALGLAGYALANRIEPIVFIGRGVCAIYNGSGILFFILLFINISIFCC